MVCFCTGGLTGVNLFTAEYKDGKWSDWQYAGDRLTRITKSAKCV